MKDSLPDFVQDETRPRFLHHREAVGGESLLSVHLISFPCMWKGWQEASCYAERENHVRQMRVNPLGGTRKVLSRRDVSKLGGLDSIRRICKGYSGRPRHTKPKLGKDQKFGREMRSSKRKWWQLDASSVHCLEIWTMVAAHLCGRIRNRCNGMRLHLTKWEMLPNSLLHICTVL